MNKKLLFLISISSAILIVANLAVAQEMHNAHVLSAVELTKPTMKLSIKKITQGRDEKNVLIELKNINDGSPVTLNDLQEAHTQKIHLMIIDQALKDYIHLHPQPTDELGVYKFTWHPNTTGNYKIWADLLPLKSHQQEYINAALLSSQQEANLLSKVISYESKVDNFTFRLSFD